MMKPENCFPIKIEVSGLYINSGVSVRKVSKLEPSDMIIGCEKSFLQMWFKMLRFQTVSAAGTRSTSTSAENSTTDHEASGADKNPHCPLRWGNTGDDITDKEWEERRLHLRKMFEEFQKQDGVDEAEREKRWRAFSEHMANQGEEKKPHGPFSFFMWGNKAEGEGDMGEKDLEERRKHFRKLFHDFQTGNGVNDAEREKRWKAFSEHMAVHVGDKKPHNPSDPFMWGNTADTDDKEWEKKRQHLQEIFEQFQKEDGISETEREKRWKAFNERMEYYDGDRRPPGPFGSFMWGKRGEKGDISEKDLEERRQHFQKIFQEFQTGSGVDDAERDRRWKAFSEHMALHNGGKKPHGPFGPFMWGNRGREHGDIDDKEWEKRSQHLQKMFEEFQKQDGVNEAEREKRWKAFNEHMANHYGDKQNQGPFDPFQRGNRGRGEKGKTNEKEWEERRQHIRKIFEEFHKGVNEAEQERRWQTFSESMANQDGEVMSQEHWHKVFSSRGRHGGWRGGRGGFGFPGWRTGRKGVEDQRLFKEFDFY